MPVCSGFDWSRPALVVSSLRDGKERWEHIYTNLHLKGGRAHFGDRCPRFQRQPVVESTQVKDELVESLGYGWLTLSYEFRRTGLR